MGPKTSPQTILVSAAISAISVGRIMVSFSLAFETTVACSPRAKSDTRGSEEDSGQGDAIAVHAETVCQPSESCSPDDKGPAQIDKRAGRPSPHTGK